MSHKEVSKNSVSDRAPIALYRKYRPEVFDEVLGQDEVVCVLKAAVEYSTVGHAYLFAGGRGTGKTTMARILARAVGTSQKDLYEIDAASNRQVDDARELRDGVATLPFESKYKFYILDEVHMFTKDAFNTLLKTLEEPPSHVIFVLATTELERVPETIRSRCQVFQFKKPTHALLKEMVLAVSSQEGVMLSQASAELVALMGDSSYRDTLSVLQKVLTVANHSKITDEEVATIVGAPPAMVILNALEAFASKNISSVLSIFHGAHKQGVEPRLFVLLLVNAVRSVLLMRFAPELTSEVKAQWGEDNAAVLARFVGKEGLTINAGLLAELITALQETPRAPMPQVPFELAVYRALL